MPSENNTPTQPVTNLEPNDYVSWPCTVPNIFTPEECKKIIELNTQLPVVDGPIGMDNERRRDTEIRDSNQQWIILSPETEWIFHRIYQAVSEANKLFKYDLYGFKEIQLTRYDVGGHYSWHPDLGKGLSSLRKLSISVQLSEPDEYEGGKLEFQTLGDEVKHGRGIGTSIMFPPFMVHRVTPVTRGTRWALVAWVKGPPFR